jgi:hypothetical protein
MLCVLAADIAALATLTENQPFRPTFVERRAAWSDGFMFDNNDQHDANDAFMKMLDTCNGVDLRAVRCMDVGSGLLDESRDAHTTPYWKIFGTRVCEEISCNACDHTISIIAYRCAITVAVPSAGVHTVEDLFIAQFGKESLGTDSDPDVCIRPRCGSINARTRTSTLIDSAPVLVVHLLRFTWDSERRRQVKLPTRVEFETIFPPVIGDTPYDLRAVVVHIGERPRSGHYISYVRAQDGAWYRCDDARQPERCSFDVVQRAEAYMLFYERR